ncbi:MAG: general secretion pathway protein GspD [Gammaproteobacteria bacterium]|nr:MAG: general secretion pathway protein GspD [Gammaproteobacteria bacterium]
MKILSNKSTVMLLMLTLSGCTSTGDEPPKALDTSFKIGGSYLGEKPATNSSNEIIISENVNANQLSEASGTMQRLPSLARRKLDLRQAEQLSSAFSSKASLTVSVNEMPTSDFLHYAFGDLLNINYIIDKNVNQADQTITLNIKEQISPQRLMQLTTELLIAQGIEIKYNDDLYFVHRLENNKKGQQVVTAIGRELSSVPRTAREILQIVPLKFGIKISIERTLRQLVGVKITPDFDQSALFLQGKREDILRALEFIHLLDAPANRGKHIGLIPLTYINSDEFTKQITLLLESEGIPVSTNNAQKKNLILVPIAQIGAIAVFSTEQSMLNRVRFWAKTIDQPLKSLTKQYFMYHPQYARASDLGESLSALLGGTGSSKNNNRTKTQTNTSANTRNNTANVTGAAPSAKRSLGVSNENITLVVDERANAIIFYTSGNEYQALLPLIRKLDVLPRQVMLDITIAEVTLTDEFQYGVEWALKSGDATLGTKGAFGVEGIGGFNFNLTGVDGELNASFFETNNLVKVLSNPTLLVRDGVTANINVGSDISVIGQTTEDPINGDRQTTKSDYRKTGVDITVTPTINAQGIVIMEIDQKISNSVPESSGSGGNPDIFERSISTEVVAQSGQTIILGGLISENISEGSRKTPWMADIPLIGYLFKAGGDNITRTELIMLITPRVIDRTDQWNDLTESFQQGLDYLTLDFKLKKK